MTTVPGEAMGDNKNPWGWDDASGERLRGEQGVNRWGKGTLRTSRARRQGEKVGESGGRKKELTKVKKGGKM